MSSISASGNNGTDNDALSTNRAATVKAHLESLGVKAATVKASGQGKRQPVTTSCSDKLPREQLILCLQPDRRVTIEVTGQIR
ncbi:MAG: OmpA family protein [Ramlibacter sp.]|nr:OmpA family protein [Ramlibacter sp.]